MIRSTSVSTWLGIWSILERIANLFFSIARSRSSRPGSNAARGVAVGAAAEREQERDRQPERIAHDPAREEPGKRQWRDQTGVDIQDSGSLGRDAFRALQGRRTEPAIIRQSPRIGRMTRRLALLLEYWRGRCRVRARSGSGHFAVEVSGFGQAGNDGTPGPQRCVVAAAIGQDLVRVQHREPLQGRHRIDELDAHGGRERQRRGSRAGSDRDIDGAVRVELAELPGHRREIQGRASQMQRSRSVQLGSDSSNRPASSGTLSRHTRLLPWMPGLPTRKSDARSERGGITRSGSVSSSIQRNGDATMSRRGAPESEGRNAVGRGAADARHRPGPHVPVEAPAHGRALPRPRSAGR